MTLIASDTRHKLEKLLERVRACELCAADLPLGPRPIVHASSSARLLIIGQAPGTRVHESGIPWNDPSGDRLRQWLGWDKERFYDESLTAIVPMGFCYPGKGKSGDLPPRPECAPQWHEPLLELMPDIELVLLVGQYAQRHYLGVDGRAEAKGNLTETVRAFREYGPRYMPLPHPSPRNQLWLKKNPWFEDDILPVLQERIRAL
ncbi:MAG TPA: IclR family transcriptional regulator [Spongiibacteraceae bacterium]|nr:IclR family transcriptional regulator [Spongiibacteraceae bacterium]HCS28331.1 IclR family transcriptional regulator [Spongiibacteraceae bacterium]